jgi:hypothetical protein
VWQSGYWLRGNAPTSNESASSAAQLEFDSSTDSVSGVWNYLAPFYPSSVTLDLVKVFSYPSGGTTAAFVGQSTGAVKIGTSATIPSLNQASLVTTLRTSSAGRRHRGRMYWPLGSGTNIGTNGQVTLSTCTGLATRLAKHFSDGNAASGWGEAVVVSQVATEAVPVTQITVDTRPDVQRRRANRMTSVQRASAAVTPAP